MAIHCRHLGRWSLASHHRSLGSISHQSIWGISAFCRKADENCALLGYYAASSGNFLPTFPDKLSVPSLGVFLTLKIWPIGCSETSVRSSWPLNMGPIGCPETSVRNYHCSLCNNPEERSSQSIWRFMVDHVVLGQVFFQALLQCAPFSGIPPMVHTRPLIYHQCYIVSATDRIIKSHT